MARLALRNDCGEDEATVGPVAELKVRIAAPGDSGPILSCADLLRGVAASNTTEAELTPVDAPPALYGTLRVQTAAMTVSPGPPAPRMSRR